MLGTVTAMHARVQAPMRAALFGPRGLAPGSGAAGVSTVARMFRCVVQGSGAAWALCGMRLACWTWGSACCVRGTGLIVYGGGREGCFTLQVGAGPVARCSFGAGLYVCLPLRVCRGGPARARGESKVCELEVSIVVARCLAARMSWGWPAPLKAWQEPQSPASASVCGNRAQLQAQNVRSVIEECSAASRGLRTVPHRAFPEQGTCVPKQSKPCCTYQCGKEWVPMQEKDDTPLHREMGPHPRAAHLATLVLITTPSCGLAPPALPGLCGHSRSARTASSGPALLCQHGGAGRQGGVRVHGQARRAGGAV